MLMLGYAFVPATSKPDTSMGNCAAKMISQLIWIRSYGSEQNPNFKLTTKLTAHAMAKTSMTGTYFHENGGGASGKPPGMLCHAVFSSSLLGFQDHSSGLLKLWGELFPEVVLKGPSPFHNVLRRPGACSPWQAGDRVRQGLGLGFRGLGFRFKVWGILMSLNMRPTAEISGKSNKEELPTQNSTGAILRNYILN